MAPDNSDEERSSDQLDPEPQTDSETKAVEALKAKSRRRTKTGCLTCRRRRIKCGEERPICRNCVKSKRHCEGYNQRVIFKPTFDYRPSPHGGAHITFQAAGPFPGPIAPVVELMPSTLDLQQYSRLTSRPAEPFIPAFGVQAQQLAAFEQHMAAFPIAQAHPMEADPRHSPHYPILLPPRPLPFHPAPLPHSTIQNEQPPVAMALHPGCITSDSLSYSTPSVASSSVHDDIPPSFVHAHGDPSAVRLAYEHQQSQPKASSLPPQLPIPPPLVQDPNLDGFVRSRPWIDTNFAHLASSDLITPPSSHSSRAFSSSTPISLSHQPWTSGALIPSFESAQPVDLHLSPTSTGHYYPAQYTAAPPPFIQSDPSTPYGFEQDVQFPVNASPNYLLTSAAIETQDDDYYDVLPQEEMDDATTSSDARFSDRHHNTLSNLLAIAQIALPGTQMRRYDTFLYHGILDHYHVEWVANPLKNPATARVFAHFISVTGPSLSIYERHPRNASVLFARGVVPFAQQGLWTYTMPMAALHHQGLLHAMLALASLHIARLQGASTTPSMQHYAWSLKRIHQCVGHEKKRLQLTTIAASMLLGFYEVMTAEHMKWNMHLAGSKQLYIETDFVKMTQEFRRMKLDRLARGKQRVSDEGQSAQDEILDQILDVDDHMVSHLVGHEVRYGNTQGSIETAQTPIPQRLNLSEFASLRDLYWWYCRQDAIQSIVSGNALLMDYGRWSNCSPRAPLGRPDAVYGSFDHLILLLGRIADFAARDRTRKLKQMEANGGQWRPGPGMKTSRPPSQQQQDPPPTPVSATSSRHESVNAFSRPPPPTGKQPATNPTMPTFYGMAPPPRVTVQMPASYMPLEPTPTLQREAEDVLQADLQVATDAALIEYGQIRAALLTFSNSLGDAFEPLTSDYHPAMQTPFGTALFYRAYDIGCLWGFYNMAMIIAIRSHPYMPPAAHAAAGVAAQETAFFANEIGRITAGIVPGSRHEPLNPSLGAALNDSCVPSFFAAVQYRDPVQRHYTVTRIFNIAQRTGWGTAELIANGCETAWVRAAEAGRGPPYERIMRSHSSNKDDPRLNGSWERWSPRTAPHEKDEADRGQVRTNAQARLNWAIGVMGSEADVGMARIEE